MRARTRSPFRVTTIETHLAGNLETAKMRAALFVVFCAAIATTSGENDESWAWNDDKQKTSKADEKAAVGEARCAISVYDLSDTVTLKV